MVRLQGPFGIDVEETGDVDQGEEQVPQLFLPGRVGGLTQGLTQLLPFLFDFVPRRP